MTHPLPNCVICYETFRDWHDLAALPCGHTFHYSCVTGWGRKCLDQGSTPTCPSCKAHFIDRPAEGIVRRLYFAFEDDAARMTKEASLEFRLELSEAMYRSAKEELENLRRHDANTAARLERLESAVKKERGEIVGNRLREWKEKKEERMRRRSVEGERGAEKSTDNHRRSFSSSSPNTVIPPPSTASATSHSSSNRGRSSSSSAKSSSTTGSKITSSSCSTSRKSSSKVSFSSNPASFWAVTTSSTTSVPSSSNFSATTTASSAMVAASAAADSNASSCVSTSVSSVTSSASSTTTTASSSTSTAFLKPGSAAASTSVRPRTSRSSSSPRSKSKRGVSSRSSTRSISPPPPPPAPPPPPPSAASSGAGTPTLQGGDQWSPNDSLTIAAGDFSFSGAASPILSSRTDSGLTFSVTASPSTSTFSFSLPTTPNRRLSLTPNRRSKAAFAAPVSTPVISFAAPSEGPEHGADSCFRFSASPSVFRHQKAKDVGSFCFGMSAKEWNFGLSSVRTEEPSLSIQNSETLSDATPVSETSGGELSSLAVETNATAAAPAPSKTTTPLTIETTTVSDAVNSIYSQAISTSLLLAVATTNTSSSSSSFFPCFSAPATPFSNASESNIFSRQFSLTPTLNFLPQTDASPVTRPFTFRAPIFVPTRMSSAQAESSSSSLRVSSAGGDGEPFASPSAAAPVDPSFFTSSLSSVTAGSLVPTLTTSTPTPVFSFSPTPVAPSMFGNSSATLPQLSFNGGGNPFDLSAAKKSYTLGSRRGIGRERRANGVSKPQRVASLKNGVKSPVASVDGEDFGVRAEEAAGEDSEGSMSQESAMGSSPESQSDHEP